MAPKLRQRFQHQQSPHTRAVTQSIVTQPIVTQPIVTQPEVDFPQFSRLPPEIRQLIWSHAAVGNGILSLHLIPPKDIDTEWLLYKVVCQNYLDRNHCIASVSRESRYTAMIICGQTPVPAYLPRTDRRVIWVNWEDDLFYVDNIHSFTHNYYKLLIRSSVFDEENVVEIPPIRRLAVPIWHLVDERASYACREVNGVWRCRSRLGLFERYWGMKNEKTGTTHENSLLDTVKEYYIVIEKEPSCGRTRKLNPVDPRSIFPLSSIGPWTFDLWADQGRMPRPRLYIWE